MKRLEQLKREKQVLATEVNLDVLCATVLPTWGVVGCTGFGCASCWCLIHVYTTRPKLPFLQVEEEEEYLINNLQKRLEQVGHLKKACLYQCAAAEGPLR